MPEEVELKTSKKQYQYKTLKTLSYDWSIAPSRLIQARGLYYCLYLDTELGHKRLVEAEDSRTAGRAGN